MNFTRFQFKPFVSLVLFYIILLASSCQTDRQYFLKGCCDNEPIQDSVGNAIVYIPNIFTPNGDGINDLFFVHGDSIRTITNFEIRDRRNTLIFIQTNIQPGDFSKAWDGKVDGTVLKSLYDVSVTIEAKDGSIEKFDTKICNYPCGTLEEEGMIPKENCYFPSYWKCWDYDGGCFYANIDFVPCFN